jgi:tripartite-type tricarboxylate transporter receptor subunit TctC
LLFAGGKHAIQPVLEKLPYDAVKSFTPIARTTTQSEALVMRPNLPAYSVKELIALAKQKPGQLIFVTSGVGTTAHVAGELLKIMTGIDFKIVHFKGAAPGAIDMMGGHSDFSMNAIPGFLPHIRSGKLRVLATTGANRSIILPDVPTVEEAGVPGFKVTSFYGMLAPAGTPAPIVNKLSEELKAMLASDEVKKRFLADGGEPDYQGPAEFGTFLEQQVNSWASFIKKANIKLDN